MQNQPGRAKEYATKAAVTNPMQVPAFELLAVIARLQADPIAADKALAQLEALDPLDHLIRFEKYLAHPSGENATAFTGMIRTELTHEAYLELAAWYLNLGLNTEVEKLLSLGPDQPEINYWRAWLAEKSGNHTQSSDLLKKANAGDPALVFPYLQESIEPLTWAMKNSVNWKPKYYLALIHWNNENRQAAKDLFAQCGDEPDFYPFYLSRVKLYESADAAATEKDLVKTVALAPQAWRAALSLSKFYESRKDYARSKEVAASAFAKLPQNYYLGLNLARQLSLNNEYEACVNLLAKLKVLPNEGATAGYHLWRESNLMVAMNAYTAKKYSKAIKFIAQSRTFPENLGVGKPYDVDERLPDFLEWLCMNGMKNTKKAAELENRIMAYPSTKGFQAEGSTNLLSAYLLRKNGEKVKADNLVNAVAVSKKGEKSTRWAEAVYSGNKSLALNIENETDQVKFTDPYQASWSDNDFGLMVKLSKVFGF